MKQLALGFLLLTMLACGGHEGVREADFERSLAAPAPADLVLRNGKIITVDRDFSIKQAVAIRDGRFVAVGAERDVRVLIGRGTRVIDLAGRTVIPGLIVDAVVVEPWGAHPSYAQGYYDRDNEFYINWEPISRDPAALSRYLDEFVHGVEGRREYVERCGGLERLRASQRVCAGVNYGF